VDVYAPITLSDSEPEPDVAVIRGDARDHSTRHPGAADAALVVEASDAPLERDRARMKPIYATAGIPWYWLVDLSERGIEVFSQPGSGDYQQCALYSSEDSAPVILDGRTLGSFPVGSIFP
jgi:Uma2 family endonuclease